MRLILWDVFRGLGGWGPRIPVRSQRVLAGTREDVLLKMHNNNYAFYLYCPYKAAHNPPALGYDNLVCVCVCVCVYVRPRLRTNRLETCSFPAVTLHRVT